MHKHAEILKALAEGKTIQYKNGYFSKWDDMPTGKYVGDVWNSLCLGKEDYSFSFRVKPVKKKGWINIYSDDGRCGYIYETQEQAREQAAITASSACIEIEYEEGQGL